MCIDFHAPNANIKLDVFPLSCIADLLYKLGKAKYSSSINLATAYQKVRIAKGILTRLNFLLMKVSMSML